MSTNCKYKRTGFLNVKNIQKHHVIIFILTGIGPATLSDLGVIKYRFHCDVDTRFCLLKAFYAMFLAWDFL